MHQYKTISKSSESEFKDRGSKFLAFTYYISNVLDAKHYLKLLKDLHPKANHHCYAYRLGMDKNNYRAVDDGEPSGSAGRPILAAIDSLELTNTLVVIVRYFGGTLLGVPGLINAYKTSTTDALILSGIIEKEVTVTYELEFEYGLTGSFNQLINRFQMNIITMENALFCTAKIEVPKSKELCFVGALEQMHGLLFKELV
jgi:uncharacterized YigZ family protein